MDESGSREPPGSGAGRSEGPAAGGRPEDRRRSGTRAIVQRVLLLLLAGASLYLLAPGLIELFGSVPRLRGIGAWWFAIIFAFVAASYWCVWALQRITLRTRSWFPVVTSQLASTAFSRVVPGGGAAGAAIQFRMLTQAGIGGTTVASSVAIVQLMGILTLTLLPLLSLPSILFGLPVDRGLRQAAWAGAGAFVVMFAVAAVLIASAPALRWFGAALQAARNRVLRRRTPMTGLPERLLAERDLARSTLGRRWWEALGAAVGRWLFEYLALVAALWAVGAQPPASLVLLAFAVSALLGMVPLTPGGLGFAEAGLTGMLTLAGVGAGEAVLATLAFRLIQFWLPIPAGALAYALHRRRFLPHRNTRPAGDG